MDKLYSKALNPSLESIDDTMVLPEKEQPVVSYQKSESKETVNIRDKLKTAWNNLDTNKEQTIHEYISIAIELRKQYGL